MQSRDVEVSDYPFMESQREVICFMIDKMPEILYGNDLLKRWGKNEATLKDWVLTKGLPAYYEDPETGILRPIDPRVGFVHLVTKAIVRTSIADRYPNLYPPKPPQTTRYRIAFSALRFKTAEVEEFERNEGLSRKDVQDKELEKEQKHKPDERHERFRAKHNIYRQFAEKQWKTDPTCAIPEMINRILKAYPHKEDPYAVSTGTIRKWIRDLCPNRSPGRRPSKKKH